MYLNLHSYTLNPKNDAALKASSLVRWFTLCFVRYGLPVWLLRVLCKGLHEHASQTRGWMNGAAMQAIQEAKIKEPLHTGRAVKLLALFRSATETSTLPLLNSVWVRCPSLLEVLQWQGRILSD